MKRILAILALLGLTSLALAQSTNVTATVVDSSSQVWQNGYITYTFQGNGSFYGQYQWNGANLPSQYLVPTTVSLNSSGVGSFSIPSSTAISPAGSTWRITICPNATFTCTTINLSITGSTEDISSQVTAAISPPIIDIQTIPRAYADSEIRIALNQGGVYYNTSSSLTGLRYWNGASFQPISGGSTGITSFNFTVPNIFTASGSPCASTGCTISFTVNTESQNTVFAGPTSGTGVPTFRLLAAADIPALPYIPSSTTIYYQTINSSGTAQNQRAALNFSPNFALTDNASPSETTVDLHTTGVSAGTYTCPSSVTVDADGRVSALVTGACPGASVQTDETGLRVWGTSYQNISGSMLIVSGFTTTPGGSSTGTITCMSGPSSPSLEVWGNEYTATVNNAPVAFFCIVPNTYFYSLSVSGDIAATPSKWIETTVN